MVLNNTMVNNVWFYMAKCAYMLNFIYVYSIHNHYSFPWSFYHYPSYPQSQVTSFQMHLKLKYYKFRLNFARCTSFYLILNIKFKEFPLNYRHVINLNNFISIVKIFLTHKKFLVIETIVIIKNKFNDYDSLELV